MIITRYARRLHVRSQKGSFWLLLRWNREVFGFHFALENTVSCIQTTYSYTNAVSATQTCKRVLLLIESRQKPLSRAVFGFILLLLAVDCAALSA